MGWGVLSFHKTRDRVHIGVAYGELVFSLDLGNTKHPSYSMDDVIVLEIEVKGSVEPFHVYLEPYALIIPGENYIGINVKKDFKVCHCLSPAQASQDCTELGGTHWEEVAGGASGGGGHCKENEAVSRAPEPTCFADAGLGTSVIYQPSSILQTTGQWNLSLCSWVFGQTWNPQTLPCVLVLLGGQDLARRVLKRPFASPQAHHPSASTDLMCKGRTWGAQVGVCLSDVEQKQVSHQICMGKDQRRPHH